MRKTLLFLLVFTITTGVFAQDIVRVKVAGKISAPKGEDLEGITVYNKSSEKGTTTNIEGGFELEMAENDRIWVAALQFQPFTVIVDSGIVASKRINIFLNPVINQLSEVVVRPYDLTGNITVDVGKIETMVVGNGWDFSYETLEFGYEFTPDALTKLPGNAAEEALGSRNLQNGANFIAIIAGLASVIFPKKDKRSSPEKILDSNARSTNLLQRFPPQYIVQTFEIPADKASQFIYYVEEKGLDQRLLKAENEIELLEFMFQKSAEFKRQLAGG